MRQPSILKIICHDQIAQAVVGIAVFSLGMAFVSSIFASPIGAASRLGGLGNTVFWGAGFVVVLCLGTPFLVDRLITVRRVFANGERVEARVVDRGVSWSHWNGIKASFQFDGQRYEAKHAMNYFKVRDVQIGDSIPLIVRRDDPRETILLDGYEKFID